MEFMILGKKKKEERNVVQEEHNLRSNCDQNIVVTNPNSDVLNLCNLSISGKEKLLKGYHKKPKASFHNPPRTIIGSLAFLSLFVVVMLLNFTDDANASPYAIMSNCLLNPQLA